METETKTVSITRYPEVRVAGAIQDGFRVDAHRTGMVLFITRDELQAIVQTAYDEQGILAVPSIALEAERVTQQPTWSAHHMPGLCRCDSPGCSDRAAKAAAR